MPFNQTNTAARLNSLALDLTALSVLATLNMVTTKIVTSEQAWTDWGYEVEGTAAVIINAPGGLTGCVGHNGIGLQFNLPDEDDGQWILNTNEKCDIQDSELLQHAIHAMEVIVASRAMKISKSRMFEIYRLIGLEHV